MFFAGVLVPAQERGTRNHKHNLNSWFLCVSEVLQNELHGIEDVSTSTETAVYNAHVARSTNRYVRVPKYLLENGRAMERMLHTRAFRSSHSQHVGLGPWRLFETPAPGCAVGGLADRFRVVSSGLCRASLWVPFKPRRHLVPTETRHQWKPTGEA